jgi:hypothetical protein
MELFFMGTAMILGGVAVATFVQAVSDIIGCMHVNIGALGGVIAVVVIWMALRYRR